MRRRYITFQIIVPYGLCKKPINSGDSTVVRALASHQCGAGSILGVDIIMWVEVVVGSHRFLRGFYPPVPRFFSFHKKQYFKIQIRPGSSAWAKSQSVEVPRLFFKLFSYE